MVELVETGSDLDELDHPGAWGDRSSRVSRRTATPPGRSAQHPVDVLPDRLGAAYGDDHHSLAPPCARRAGPVR